MPKRENLYTSPVVPIEYPADDEPVHPCPDCLPWHVEIVQDHPEGGVWVREWHAVGCSWLASWLAGDGDQEG